ncbi:unnamed protein product, partial [Owenia fusiformis]
LDCTWQPASFKSKAVYTYVTASLKTCNTCEPQVITQRYGDESSSYVNRCRFNLSQNATYFHVDVNLSNPFDEVGKSANISGDSNTLIKPAMVHSVARAVNSSCVHLSWKRTAPEGVNVLYFIKYCSKWKDNCNE